MNAWDALKAATGGAPGNAFALLAKASAGVVTEVQPTWYSTWDESGWAAGWVDMLWRSLWRMSGGVEETDVIQAALGTTWNPSVLIEGVPASAGVPADFVCTWGLKKYADSAAMLIGPVASSCVLHTDGVSWKLSAAITPAMQILSPALAAGVYVMLFKIENGDSSIIKDFRTTLELLPAGLP